MKKDKQKNNGFTKVPNIILWNEELSLQEKALLAIMMSNASIWKTRIMEIYSRSQNCEASQRKTLTDLISKGFVTRNRTKNASTKQFEYEYILNKIEGFTMKKKEKPSHQLPQVEKPHMETPPMEKPQVESPEMESDGTNNTNTNNTKTDKTNSDKNKEIKISKANASENIPGNGSEFNPPLLEEVKAYFETNGSNAKAALAFFQEFSQRHWYTVKGEKVKSWKAIATFFIKNQSDSVSELSEQDRKKIRELGDKLYAAIYQNVYDSLPENDKIYAARVNKSDVIQCLFQVCLNNKIYTHAALREHLETNKVSVKSMAEFKKSLGLATGGSGKKYN
jgi:predicted transcriptional regulator